MVLRSMNQLRHKTGVTGPGEWMNPIQHMVCVRASAAVMMHRCLGVPLCSSQSLSPAALATMLFRAERKDGDAPVWLHLLQPPCATLEPGWRLGPGHHPPVPQRARQRRAQWFLKVGKLREALKALLPSPVPQHTSSVWGTARWLLTRRIPGLVKCALTRTEVQENLYDGAEYVFAVL